MIDKTPEMVAIEALGDKVDTLHDVAQQAFERGSRRMDKQDDRLRAVERKQAWFMGAGAAVATVIAFLQKLPVRLWEFITS